MKTLDIDECAEFLKVDRTTVMRLAGIGELPGAKIGRAWVFLQDDLVAYLRTKVNQQMRLRAAEQEIDEHLATAKASPMVVVPAPKRTMRKSLPTLAEV